MDLIDLETPDGSVEAYRTGSGPGVLLLMDAFGLRLRSGEWRTGSPHGYAMGDTAMYHEPGAERSFAALHALLEGTLARA